MKTVKNYELRIRRIPVAEEPVGYQTAITDRQTVERLAKTLIGDSAQEVFLAFSLDIKNRVIGYTEVGRGGVDGCAVDLRQIFRMALILGASNIVVAHNHPSGDPTPSSEDKILTKRVAEAAKLLGLPLLDHVIVTNEPESYSFREKGNLL